VARSLAGDKEYGEAFRQNLTEGCRVGSGRLVEDAA
jgi:hypothetical protein